MYLQDVSFAIKQKKRAERETGRYRQAHHNCLPNSLPTDATVLLCLHKFTLIYPKLESNVTYAGQAFARSCVDPHEKWVSVGGLHVG